MTPIRSRRGKWIHILPNRASPNALCPVRLRAPIIVDAEPDCPRCLLILDEIATNGN